MDVYGEYTQTYLNYYSIIYLHSNKSCNYSKRLVFFKEEKKVKGDVGATNNNAGIWEAVVGSLP